MISFSCEYGKRYSVKDELAGKRAKCSCDKTLAIPESVAAVGRPAPFAAPVVPTSPCVENNKIEWPNSAPTLNLCDTCCTALREIRHWGEPTTETVCLHCSPTNGLCPCCHEKLVSNASQQCLCCASSWHTESSAPANRPDILGSKTRTPDEPTVATKHLERPCDGMRRRTQFAQDSTKGATDPEDKVPGVVPLLPGPPSYVIVGPQHLLDEYATVVEELEYETGLQTPIKKEFLAVETSAGTVELFCSLDQVFKQTRLRQIDPQARCWVIRERRSAHSTAELDDKWIAGCKDGKLIEYFLGSLGPIHVASLYAPRLSELAGQTVEVFGLAIGKALHALGCAVVAGVIVVQVTSAYVLLIPAALLGGIIGLAFAPSVARNFPGVLVYAVCVGIGRTIGSPIGAILVGVRSPSVSSATNPDEWRRFGPSKLNLLWRVFDNAILSPLAFLAISLIMIRLVSPLWQSGIQGKFAVIILVPAVATLIMSTLAGIAKSK